MLDTGAERRPQSKEEEWVTFEGGELQGKRPEVQCAACRARSAGRRAAKSPPARSSTVCFGCYRAALEYERALGAAGRLETASPERFQTLLPFEPVNRARLEKLRADRAVARATMRSGVGLYVDRRRRAQIAARHALQRVAAGVHSRESRAANGALSDAAIRALELQLPDSWLPFVVCG